MSFNDWENYLHLHHAGVKEPSHEILESLPVGNEGALHKKMALEAVPKLAESVIKDEGLDLSQDSMINIDSINEIGSYVVEGSVIGQQILPGVADFFLNDPSDDEYLNDEYFYKCFNAFPEYISKQIKEICSQNPEMGSKAKSCLVLRDGGGEVIKRSKVSDVLLLIRGFTEVSRVQYRVNIPVMEFCFPGDAMLVGFNTDASTAEKRGFKVSVCGFSGGFGVDTSMSLNAKYEESDKSAQAHVVAEVLERKLVKNKYEISTVEVINVEDDVFLVYEDSSEYLPLESPNIKEHRRRIGNESTKVAYELTISRGDWAEFSLGASLGRVMPTLDFGKFSTGIRSESLGEIKISITPKREKIFHLRGAETKRSLRLFVEEP